MRMRNELLALFPLLAACVFVGVWFPHLGADAVGMPLFMVAFVLLPSFAFGQWLLPLRLSVVESMALGYPAGIAFFFLLFWLGALVGAPHLPLLCLACSAWALWRIFRGGLPTLETRTALLFAAFNAAAVALYLADLLITNPVPPVSGATLYLYKDFSIFSSEISALARFLTHPPLVASPFVHGLSIGYHFLQMLVPAYYDFIFHALPLNYLVFISPLFGFFFLVGAIFVGGRRLGGISDTQAAILAFLILFSAGNDRFWWGFQVYWANFSFFFSMPFFILFVFLCVHVLVHANKSLPVYTSLLVLAAGGAKGPLAAILPLSLVPVFLVRLRRRQFTRADALSLVGICFAVLVLKYTFFLAPTRAEGAVHALVPGLLWACEMVWNILCTPEGVLLIALALLDRIFRIRSERLKPLYAVLFSLIAASAVVPYLLGFDIDVYYFYWYGRFALLIGTSYAIAYVADKRRAWQVCAAVLVLLLGVARFAHFHATTFFFLPEAARKGQKAPVDSLTSDEWSALNWLRTHASRDSLMISNRIKPAPVRRLEEVSYKETTEFYHYTAFSGLASYLSTMSKHSGSSGELQRENFRRLTDFLYAPDPAAAAAALRLIPADYFVQCLRFENLDYSKTAGLTEIYRNPTMIIYRIEHSHGAPAQGGGQ